MTLISDKYQNEKLNKLNINIKTKFIVGDKILERNSNNTYNFIIKNSTDNPRQLVLEKYALD